MISVVGYLIPRYLTRNHRKKKKTKLNARYADWECGKFEKLVETHSEIESRMKKKKKTRIVRVLVFFFAEKLSWSSKIRDPVFYNTEGERGDSGVK